MAWIDYLAEIEDLEDAEFDAGLVASFERAAAGHEQRPIRFSTPTFKEYSRAWLEEYVSTLADSTYEKYHQTLRDHIWPAFGGMTLLFRFPRQPAASTATTARRKSSSQ